MCNYTFDNYASIIMYIVNLFYYILVLASGLKHIGYEGNPISDPPQHIRKQGFERIMQYFKEQFEFTEGINLCYLMFK